MPTVTLAEARSDLVRRRALDGAAAVLGRGDDLTYAAVAAAAGVPERTLYRHFPTRAALLAAVFAWANERIGFRGEYPTGEREIAQLVRSVFSGFDSIAPVIRELLIAPEGRLARLADKPARQRAALALVQHELAGLDRVTARRVAAVLQLLTTAGTWQTLRDYWDIDGAEAGEAAALGIELLLEGARSRSKRPVTSSKARARKKERP